MSEQKIIPAILPGIGGIAVIFFSNHSKACNKLRTEYLPDQFLPLFIPICIDCPEVRKILNASKNIKIDYVPCILHIAEGGNVSKYESNKAFEWVQQFITMLQQRGAPQQANSSQLMTPGGMPVSSLQQLGLGVDTEPRPEAHMASQLATKQPATRAKMSTMDAMKQVIQESRGPVDEEQPIEQYEQVPMREYQPDLPNRGRRQPFEVIREDPVPVSDDNPGYSHPGIQVIEDVSFQPAGSEMGDAYSAELQDNLAHDPSGMGGTRTDSIPIVGKAPDNQPRPQMDNPSGMADQRGSSKYQRNLKSQAIKDVASSMGKKRDEQEASISKRRQAPLEQQRRAAK